MKRNLNDGGASLDEVRAATDQLVNQECMEELKEQQEVLSRRSLVRPPRPGSHDQMPSVDALVAKVTAGKTGDLSCGDDAAIGGPPEPPARVVPGGEADKVQQHIAAQPAYDPATLQGTQLVSASNRVVSTAVVGIHNKAKSSTETIRQIEVIAAPRSVVAQFPRGFFFVERVGGGLFDLFGLPMESGRVYHISVTEHPSSAPAPRPNPFKPGCHL